MVLTVVFFCVAVFLGCLAWTWGKQGEVWAKRYREGSRQRRRIGEIAARREAKIVYLEPELEKVIRERDDARAALTILADQHEAQGQHFKKLHDKYSVAAEKLKELERDPHYQDGCAKIGAFRLKEDAEAFAAYLENRNGEPMNVYPCKQCREHFTGNIIFHVGHMESRAMRMAAATRLSPENMQRLRAKVV